MGITAVNEELAQQYGFYTRLNQIESGDVSFSYLNNSNNALNETNTTTSNNLFNSNATNINISYTIPENCYFNDWNDPNCAHYIKKNDQNLYPCASDPNDECFRI